MARKRKEFQVIVTQTDQPMPPEQFQAWIRTVARIILNRNGIATKSEYQITRDRDRNARGKAKMTRGESSKGFAKQPHDPIDLKAWAQTYCRHVLELENAVAETTSPAKASLGERVDAPES